MASRYVAKFFRRQTENGEMKTYWGKAGTPITIPCSINLYNEENFSLDWRKDGQLILSAFGQEQGHVTPTLQDRIYKNKTDPIWVIIRFLRK
ncbi:hypothetical protein L5515_018038 [Caenorhabditis briggsae]|uniref:Uncharacterized protein n=1 Tax=Caenorhabditis briggsae TaxID=6238 RepID=A0AAE9FFY5_CAEBR|nr:hypothetical protein L5515_018038 [Caenorhabditis briggsae]